MSIYLNHPKLDLNHMFTLNFGNIYLCQFYVLFEGVKSKKRIKIMCMIKERYIMHEMFQTHQEAFQCQITFQLVKTMSETHKDIANNAHLACFSGNLFFKILKSK
jgi:hypothetical protein